MHKTQHHEPRHARAAKKTHGNGASAEETPQEQTPPAPDPRLQRAEEMVDRIGAQVGHFASLAAQQLLTWKERAREEAEDMWAEAQEIRQRWASGRQPPPDESGNR
jgi:hypothetical protein